MIRRLSPSVALALLAACFPISPGVSALGKTCVDGGPACPGGLLCLQGACALPDGGSGSSGTSGTTGTSGTGSSTSGSAGCGGVGEACCGGSGCNMGLLCAAGSCACTAASCSPGCCDANGCESGTLHDACGPAGGACEQCTPFQACTSSSRSCAVCGTLGKTCCDDLDAGAACGSGLACAGGTCQCDAASCPNGCCDANGCELGTSEHACGTAGAACHTCDPSQACTDGGCSTCSGVGQPCCLDDAGVANSCGANLACVSGFCACTPSSCGSGCCDSAGCELGDSTSACGAGGRACAICGLFEGCQSGTCCGGDGGACCSGALCEPGLGCRAPAACQGTPACLPPASPAVTYSSPTDTNPSSIALLQPSPIGPATAVFWTNQTTLGSVQYALTAAPQPNSTQFKGPSGAAPFAVAITVGGQRVVWTDLNFVYSCNPFDGGLGCDPASFYMLNQGLGGGYISGPLVIDRAATTPYFGKSVGFNAGIDTCPFSTCMLPSTATMADPLGMALNGSNLYWTDGTGTVGILDLANYAMTMSVQPLPTDAGSGALAGIAIDSSYAYFAIDDQIQRVPLGGGSASFFARGPTGGCPTALAVNASYLYWTDPCTGSIYREATQCSGAPLESVWNQGSKGGRTEPMGLALDNLNLYWSDPVNNTVQSISQ